MEASSSSSSSGGSALWGLLPLPPGGFMADARRAPVSRLRLWSFHPRLLRLLLSLAGSRRRVVAAVRAVRALPRLLLPVPLGRSRRTFSVVASTASPRTTSPATAPAHLAAFAVKRRATGLETANGRVALWAWSTRRCNAVGLTLRRARLMRIGWRRAWLRVRRSLVWCAPLRLRWDVLLGWCPVRRLPPPPSLHGAPASDSLPASSPTRVLRVLSHPPSPLRWWRPPGLSATSHRRWIWRR